MKATDFIRPLIVNNMFATERVLEFIERYSATTDKMLRALAYVTGMLDKPNVNETSDKVEEKRATLIEYDFFENRVRYRYVRSRKVKVTFGFAEIYDGEPFADYYKIPDNVRDSDGVEIDVYYWDNTYCSLNEWQD